MGGRSEGNFAREPGQLRFAGRTNTNGGGFSSIRSATLALDLSACQGVRLQARGDGRRYTWRLTTNARWRGHEVAYRADFATDKDAWRTVDIPFSAFKPKIRGTTLDGPPLDLAQITGMGLMIYDGLDGPFELQLASVSAYAPAMPFTLDRYRWKNRVLVISAHAAEDSDLTLQQQAVAASADAFADRELVLVTLLDAGPSATAERTLAEHEVAAVRAELGMPPGSFSLRLIGKDGSVKLASDVATSMADVYALIDTMPMRRSETGPRLD
jgi:hypothetical protein